MFKLKTNNRRSNQVKINALLGFLIKGVSILVSLMLVPMTIDYVSSELYGVWLTISTIVHWISFFDVGFGNGLRNKLAEALSLNNYKEGKILVSSTYCALGSIFITVGTILFIVTGYINWSSVLNVDPIYNTTLISVVRIVLCSFCFQIFLKVIQNVAQAHQMNALSSAIDTIGNIVVLCAIFILTKTTFPDLKWLAFAFSLSPVAVLIIFSIALYSTRFKEVSPSTKYIKRDYISTVFTLGSKFFVIQIAAIVLYQTINVIISNVCGPSSVTIYNIAYKYLSVSFMAYHIIMAPIWSAFTDAYAQNDWKWMQNVYKKLLTILGLSVILIICMIVVSPFVYRIWLKDSVDIPFVITMLIGLYMVVLNFSGLHSQILNGIGIIKLELYEAVAQALAYIPIAYVMAQYFGLEGCIISLIIVTLLPTIIQVIQVRKIFNHTAHGLWNR